jgi:fructose-1,6-bisphosphatase/inositol monophosphatase family enzyme
MTLNTAEISALACFREGKFPKKATAIERDDWITFGLSVALEAARLLRDQGPNVDTSDVDLKVDGSPVTELDRRVEEMVRAALYEFHPGTAIIGEEGGGELPPNGPAVAIDPVDGTWAYVSGTGTAATTLAVFENASVRLGVIANPTTGEIAYADRDGEARLVQLGVFGEADRAYSLPTAGADPTKVLVNVQPSSAAGPVIGALYEAWGERRIQALRSSGGSPAWALLETAKGRYVYVNMWSKRPAAPYDLAAGVLMVRAAGGEVVGLDGQPVDLVRHAGPFVAGIAPAARAAVLEIVRAAAG